MEEKKLILAIKNDLRIDALYVENWSFDIPCDAIKKRIHFYTQSFISKTRPEITYDLVASRIINKNLLEPDRDDYVFYSHPQQIKAYIFPSGNDKVEVYLNAHNQYPNRIVGYAQLEEITLKRDQCLRFFQKSDKINIQEYDKRLEHTERLLDRAYEHLSDIAIAKNYKPGWMYHRISDEEKEIQKFWVDEKVYMTINPFASKYCDRFKREHFPKLWQRELEQKNDDFIDNWRF